MFPRVRAGRSYIKDVLLRLNLPISKVRGQCYDGAATMAGCISGVATRMNADEPRAIFTHCYGHSLNLACCDTIKQSKLMHDALDTTHEITKLIKKSPGREATFKSLRCETVVSCPDPMHRSCGWITSPLRLHRVWRHLEFHRNQSCFMFTMNIVTST